MRNVRMIRGLVVAGVSVFLVAGVAFAADGVLRPAGSDRSSLVSPAETARTTPPRPPSRPTTTARTTPATITAAVTTRTVAAR